MSDRKCNLQTNIGKASIDYMVGLPQGQVYSILGSNLVCNAKKTQWTAKDDTCKIKYDRGYSFTSKDTFEKTYNRTLDLHTRSNSDNFIFILHDNNKLTTQEQISQ